MFSCMGRFEGVRPISAAEGEEEGAVNIKRILLRAVIPLPELVETSVLDLRHIL